MSKFRVALLAMTTAGLAASAAPANAQRYDWGGLYFGGSVGYAWSDVNWTFVPTAANSLFTDRGTLGQNVSHELSDIIGGGHIGVQHQFGQFVLGLEASMAGGKLKDSSLSTFGARDDVFTTDIGWLFAGTVRAGYAMNQTLLYIKGGFAGANIRTSVNDVVPANVGTAGDQQWHTGWTIGGGIEYAFDRNWSLGIEYNYYDLDAKTHSRFSGGTTFIVDSVDPDPIHTISARLTFRLGRDPAPAPRPLK